MRILLPRLAIAAAALALAAAPLIGQARPGVTGFSPSGTVAAPAQIVVRFATPMVAMGAAGTAPISGDCGKGGQGRWLDPQRFAIDLPAPIPGGRACQFRLAAGLADIAGRPLPAAGPFRFTTPGPAIRAVLPDGGDVAEDQIFLIATEAQPTAASLNAGAACLIDGVGERVPLDVLPNASRDAILKSARGDWSLNYFLERAGWRADYDGNRAAPAHLIAARCRRPLPPGGQLTLSWRGSIAAPNGLKAGTDWQQRFRVRQPFTATVACTRTNAGAACSPLDSIRVDFTAPVPRSAALAARLRLPDGRSIAPEPPADRANTTGDIRFKGPWPARARLTLSLPASLKDDAGRSLANAARFPLAIPTGDFPPLAKFAGRFGILEAQEGGILPVTLRGVENPLPTATLSLPVPSLRIDDDAQVAKWLRRVERAGERRFRDEPLAGGGYNSVETTGSQSLLADERGSNRLTITRPRDGAMQVVGIPLKTRGLHIVELASPALGRALTGPGQTYHVSTAALVTNMAVHFQWGDGASLVWVTRLADATPVSGARISISNSCTGERLWQGRTDASGRALVPAGQLPKPATWTACDAETPTLMASARTADDYSFALTSWGDGIQAFDFNLPYGGWNWRPLAHAVFDRTLARPGERINFKLFRRLPNDRGFTRPKPAPFTLTARHWQSDTILPITLGPGADPAGQIILPASAPTGDWELRLATPDGDETGVGNFQVEEFRLPTLRAAISGPKAMPVAPASLPLDLALTYFSGGSAAGAPVTLRTRVVPRSVEVPGLDGFTFDAEAITPGLSRLEEGEAAAAPIRARETPLNLGRTGTARVAAGGWAPITRPAMLVAEMDYPDANGEIATRIARLPLEPAALRVGIARDGWLMKADDARLKLVVLGLDNKPLAGRAIRVRLFAREIISTRKRLVGGFYAYDNMVETRELKAGCTARSDARGRAICQLDPGISGEVIALAEVQDDAGRTTRASQSLWLAGDDEWWFGGDNGDRMDLVPEVPEVAVGGTARLAVRMPFREATALVTIMRSGVIESFVTTLSGKEPVVEVKIKGNHAPNVYVSVLAVRGRVAGWRLWLADLARRWNLPWLSRDGAAPTALVDLARPSWRIGMAQLKVGHDAHRLAVTVTPDRPTHAVREAASARIRVTPPRGTALPADAEVAFAVVDEALLALKSNDSWNLLNTMMEPRPLGVVMASAQGQVVGKRHYGAKAVAAGGGGGATAGMARREFTPIIAWAGRVKLNPRGEALVPFRLNDSLSGFRLVAIASAGPGLFGTGSASLRTTQDLQILPGIPPLVRQGDEFVATATLRNTSAAAMTATVTLTNGTASLPAQRVALPAGGAANLRWPLVAGPPGSQRIAIRASAGTAKDAVTIAQTIEPAIPEQVVAASLIRPGQPLMLQLPPGAQAGAPSGHVDVALLRSLASLPGVRAYMAAYPHDCIEQRLSRAVAMGDRARWDAEAAGILTYADSTGLLRYFPTASLPGDPDLTAYVLRLSRLAGWPLPDAARARLISGLTPIADGRRAVADSTRLAAIAALAGEGVPVARMLAGLNIAPDRWGPAALMDWLAIARASGNARDTAATLTRLRARLDDRGTVMRFAGVADDWSLMADPDAALARLLLIASADANWAADAPRLARALTQAQQRGHWRSTPANALGTLALQGFAGRFEGGAVSGTSRVTLADQAASIAWPANGDPAPARLRLAAGQLAITHQGGGTPWAQVTMAATVPQTRSLAAGLTLSRTVRPVAQAVPGRWSRGDVIAVRLTLKAAALTPWVALIDPVPAGATILGNGLANFSELLDAGTAGSGMAPDWIDRRTGAVQAYWRALSGTASFEYRLRLGSEGRFTLPPARAEAMYAPDIRAALPATGLTVAAGK
ncbi:alpha-2-macroglobulin family protein [Sandarakinorhabdus cyanobacteriorum]|uniref:alpha-2-macroglobulin family protein n=1 Tax=Sandarakinorhabdus cyanobacteriorum TaxID=1981098 RepID=UPI0010548CF2|nr:alpha-2-macroglobulin family protein [Sandarakinorhabdus cyanobacteriorum]